MLTVQGVRPLLQKRASFSKIVGSPGPIAFQLAFLMLRSYIFCKQVLTLYTVLVVNWLLPENSLATNTRESLRGACVTLVLRELRRRARLCKGI